MTVIVAGTRTSEGVAETYQGSDARSRDAVGDLLDWSERLQASAIVVGVRHRSPVGKLLVGSAAQQIVLESNVPVSLIARARRTATTRS